jgi:hypothetical protein
MPLRVELWTAAPPDDLDDWEEAFEATLAVSDDGIDDESPAVEFTNIAVPAGMYRALITGTGFVAHGWPGSTEPRATAGASGSGRPWSAPRPNG